MRILSKDLLLGALVMALLVSLLGFVRAPERQAAPPVQGVAQEFLLSCSAAMCVAIHANGRAFVLESGSQRWKRTSWP